MQILSWHKRSPTGWLLKAENGEIWGAVTRYRSEFASKNQFKATVIRSDYRSPDGRLPWSTGIGARSAKLVLEKLLVRASGAFENFDIASRASR